MSTRQPAASPGPIRAASLEQLPSLARFHRNGDADGWYVLVDPAGRRTALGRAERTIDFAPFFRTLIFLVCIVGCGLWAAQDRSSAPVTLLFFLLGGSLGALLGGLVTSLLRGVPHKWHRSADDGPRLRVLPSDGRAWRLCETVAALAETGSWTDRTVDPRRRAPSILWAAAGRSLEVERQYRDARSALDHESLQDLGRETLARVQRERESLDAVDANLRAVLASAREIDRRRAEREQARRRRAAERELRSRMTGGRGSLADIADAEHQADHSAGLAAEAGAISDLLAESDALLLDLD